MPTRKATASWSGDLPNGSGTMAFGGGAFEGAFSFRSRFEDGVGTNPEELIAAAHAGCFSMALSNILAEAGHTPEKVNTTAHVHLDPKNEPPIKKIELVTEADVPGLDDAALLRDRDAQKAGLLGRLAGRGRRRRRLRQPGRRSAASATAASLARSTLGRERGERVVENGGRDDRFAVSPQPIVDGTGYFIARLCGPPEEGAPVLLAAPRDFGEQGPGHAPTAGIGTDVEVADIIAARGEGRLVAEVVEAVARYSGGGRRDPALVRRGPGVLRRRAAVVHLDPRVLRHAPTRMHR